MCWHGNDYNFGTLDSQTLYHHPTQTQASGYRGTWRKAQVD